MRHETETKPSNTELSQHEPTAHAGKEMFLLRMLDEHGLQSSEDALCLLSWLLKWIISFY